MTWNKVIFICFNVFRFNKLTYIEANKDHFVSCHLFNEEIMSNLDKYDQEYDRLEQEKIENENNNIEKSN